MKSLWHTVLMKRHARLPIGFITRAGRRPAVRLVFACALCLPWPASAGTCYGSSANGRLDGGVQLPASGVNFVAYSADGVGLGRTYVHDVVRQIVVDTYARLEQTMPGKTFVYGETGLEHGGMMPPHKTHQAGLSVDFMVPVLDKENRSVPLPSTPSNRFGYGLEFDGDGRIPGFRIDFEAMAEHLFQLSLASRRHGIAIKRVIFDRRLQDKLFNTETHGAELKRSMPFMKGEPWIRHDEHYHVDFDLACRPLSEFSSELRPWTDGRKSRNTTNGRVRPNSAVQPGLAGFRSQIRRLLRQAVTDPGRVKTPWPKIRQGRQSLALPLYRPLPQERS